MKKLVSDFDNDMIIYNGDPCIKKKHFYKYTYNS